MEMAPLSVWLWDGAIAFTISPSQYVGFLILFISFFLLVAYLLRPKYFYIVRHGETLLNKAHIKQGAEGKLSEKGIAQARDLGTAFNDLRIQEIFSSPYERALETASLMNETLHVPITPTSLLAERKSPSEILGKSTTEPDVERVTGLTAYGYHADGYRYSDEENFEDLRTRAKHCLSFLASLRAHRSVVVTHHAFLQMLLSYLLYRDTLNADGYVKLAYFNPAENGAVTVCVYHPWHSPFSPTRGWEIIAYNQELESA